MAQQKRQNGGRLEAVLRWGFRTCGALLLSAAFFGAGGVPVLVFAGFALSFSSLLASALVGCGPARELSSDPVTLAWSRYRATSGESDPEAEYLAGRLTTLEFLDIVDRPAVPAAPKPVAMIDDRGRPLKRGDVRLDLGSGQVYVRSGPQDADELCVLTGQPYVGGGSPAADRLIAEACDLAREHGRLLERAEQADERLAAAGRCRGLPAPLFDPINPAAFSGPVPTSPNIDPAMSPIPHAREQHLRDVEIARLRALGGVLSPSARELRAIYAEAPKKP